jgi:N-succinyldiaminopimelate aminotransferase
LPAANRHTPSKTAFVKVSIAPSASVEDFALNVYNERLSLLQPYPFERLRELTAGIEPPNGLAHIPLSLGEPKHAPPSFVLDALADRDALKRFIAMYPATKGSDELRSAIGEWLTKRFAVNVDPATETLPVNGTREALFSFAQAVVAPGSIVLMPNPFYQIYEGAALLAGAEPRYVSSYAAQDYRQNFEELTDADWRRTQLLYICSPGNPTGVNLHRTELQKLIELAHQHDFIIASDECYSEIYFDDENPPDSLLAASEAMGNAAYARCVVFHSLSKRSNLPGLRSGFVAGDREILSSYLKYRTYHGCAMGAHTQAASAMAWRDEKHVVQNLALYRAKFKAVTDVLAPHYKLRQPQGAFYHWLETPSDDQTFCRELLRNQNVTVMPGSFLARDDAAGNPGTNHVRVAWVATEDDCVAAARRLADFV